MEVDKNFWKEKRVLVTGHTGFKGSWLCLWLQSMGADLFGISLSPLNISMFNSARVEEGMNHYIGDIRDLGLLKKIFCEINPEVIFHMAAQPLVRYSYDNPIETFETNIIGTANIFEASLDISSLKAIVNITTDKCYEEINLLKAFKENDRLGGKDPYSSSKACAELVSSAYRFSFLSKTNIAMATARAGNVIGGGDWSYDRLVPDIIRALEIKEEVEIRNPNAIRPWQHVLEPLSGYLTLAQKLDSEGQNFAESWNFGPNEDDNKSVSWIVENLYDIWGVDSAWRDQTGDHPYEAEILKLDITKAKKRLNWFPKWTLREALLSVTDWHKAFLNKEDMRLKTLEQINEYSSKTV